MAHEHSLADVGQVQAMVPDLGSNPDVDALAAAISATIGM